MYAIRSYYVAGTAAASRWPLPQAFWLPGYLLVITSYSIHYTKLYELAIAHVCSPLGRVLTLSAGVAVAYPDGTESEEALIALADKGLYGAKERGRNQVAVHHGQPVP